MVRPMADGDRKSSEDLIEEARRRLRSGPTGVEGEIARPPLDPVAEPPNEPVALQYRSDLQTATEATSVEPAVAPSRRRSAVGVGVIRWALALLVFGGWFLFTRLDDASRDRSGEIVGGGDLGVMAMQVGDCFDDPEEAGVVVDVAATPCSEPHDNEVFGVLSLAAAFPDDAYPGEDPLWDHSFDICSGSLFDDYVGTSYRDSSLEVFSLTPSQESWEDGDREFVCALYRLDLGQLTGTARDSGL